MSKALLIGNGDPVPADFLKRLAGAADFVLAADGGANKAVRAGVTPRAVIGDLDSVLPQTRQACPDTQFIRVDNQNNTDLEKALDWLLEKGFTSCEIVCGVGGRWDFSIGNFLSVYPYAGKINLAFKGPGWSIYPLTRGGTFPCKPGGRVSVIPVTACPDVTLKGLKYPLEHAHLKLGGTGLTLSNEATAGRFEVSFDSGYLLVYAED